jgi:hypothetical protein
VLFRYEALASDNPQATVPGYPVPIMARAAQAQSPTMGIPLPSRAHLHVKTAAARPQGLCTAPRPSLLCQPCQSYGGRAQVPRTYAPMPVHCSACLPVLAPSPCTHMPYVRLQVTH